MTSLLFITAPQADHKQINRILIHLRDYDYSDGEDDFFKLVTTKNAYDLDLSTDSGSEVITAYRSLEETSPPVPIDIENAWAGASLDDIEEYCADLARADVKGANPGLFVVIDAEGLREEDCILVEEQYEWEERGTARFWKMRVPWDELYITWCQLEVGNASFEEMTEEVEETNDEERRKEMSWFTFRTTCEDSGEGCPGRDAAIEELRKEGRA